MVEQDSGVVECPLLTRLESCVSKSDHGNLSLGDLETEAGYTPFIWLMYEPQVMSKP